MNDAPRFPRTIPLVGILILLSLAFCTSVPGADPSRGRQIDQGRRYLKELAERSKAIRSLHARFRQEKRLRLLRRPRVSEGEIWYARERFAMKVRQGGEVESHLVVGDGVLRILYPRLGRLETMKLGAGSGGGTDLAIPFLSGDWDAVEKQYDVTARADAAAGAGEVDRVVLELTPRDSKSPVKRLRVVLVDGQLREYVQEDRKGNQVHMKILSWEENAEIPAERFRMDVPEGTKTVRLR